MKLSILICSVQKRLTQFALLAEHLEKQTQSVLTKLGNVENNLVEILWLGDNKTMTVGEKRNKLLALAKGEYIAFVDDDDWVADNYIDEILKGIEEKKDCVCFNAIYTSEASPPSEGGPLAQTQYLLSGGRGAMGEAGILVLYSINNILNVDEPNKPRLRVPNHLMPIKREHALATKFLEKNFGEDTDYGLRVRRLLKTEYKIEKPLYHYRFSFATSETHKYSPKYRRPASKPMVELDVVMVSDATPSRPSPSEEGGMQAQSFPAWGDVEVLQRMTQAAINSVQVENVNIIVLEKAPHIKYAHADTFLQRQPFNYNQCLNNGAAMGNAEFICFTNNDVLFPKGFANGVVEEMRDKQLDVLSVLNQHSYIHPHIISGFCFIMRRSAWHKIGKLNTDYRFWCADNVTSEQIKQHNLREGRSDIKVFHGTSVTLNKLDADTKEEYTRTCVRQFNHDYDKNVLGIGR